MSKTLSGCCCSCTGRSHASKNGKIFVEEEEEEEDKMLQCAAVCLHGFTAKVTPVADKNRCLTRTRKEGHDDDHHQTAAAASAAFGSILSSLDDLFIEIS